MANESFSDHFSPVATDYAAHRPTYPEAIFSYLASLCDHRDCVWDCATGNGQAAIGLARHFERVVATDPSENQIAQAKPHPQIAYRVETAHKVSLPDHSADLVTVAQALHWFCNEAFFDEVKRVLKPGAPLAAWTYAIFDIPDRPEVIEIVLHLYGPILNAYWPPERRHIETGYRTLPFPFDEVTPPSFSMIQAWDLHRMLGFLRSWSATQAYLREKGQDPVALIEDDLRLAWGPADRSYPLNWPLTMRVGRNQRETR